MSVEIQDSIIMILEQLSCKRYGFAKLTKPLSMSYYSNWVDSGFAGTMEYLKTHESQKSNPQELMPLAQSAIVVAVDYIPHPEPMDFDFSLPVARYAQGSDYHFWLKDRLEKIILKLKSLYPNEVFRAFSDSAPVLERDLAHRAGLGWVGKNTCLIDQRHGSFFLIGEIYTSLNLAQTLDTPQDRCGTCTRCIDACPTQALIEPRKLDARRCISYLTIEAKHTPSVDLRNKIGANYFGCDICQDVCPWNQKAFGIELKKPKASQEDIIKDLKFILSSSNRQIESKFNGTPLMRAPGWGHKRNALVLIANLKLQSLRDDVQKLCSNPRLAELATWTLETLDA